jgi:hypothetical protein
MIILYVERSSEYICEYSRSHSSQTVFKGIVLYYLKQQILFKELFKSAKSALFKSILGTREIVIFCAFVRGFLG